MNHQLASVPLAATGHHAPLEIALPIIVVVVIAQMLFSRSRGRPAIAGEIVVRCSQGHVFRTIWSPLGSFASVRLGSARFQHCPVGHHWSLVRPVEDADLTDEDRRMLDERR
ncbi:MAG TPA: hypothetical protein VNS09_19260 [Solirubrobacter sp.]|nr:hypothetical protein [Solirubrobacter sp.]